jgi:hypothetical protein
MNGCPDPNGERKSPCENRPDNEKGKAVPKAFQNLRQYRLIVFPGDGSAGKEIPVVVKILNVERFIQMKGFAETFHELRSESGVERIHLARFARREVNDEERDDGDEEQSDDLLNEASADERKHKKCLNLKKIVMSDK